MSPETLLRAYDRCFILFLQPWRKGAKMNRDYKRLKYFKQKILIALKYHHDSKTEEL